MSSASPSSFPPVLVAEFLQHLQSNRYSENSLHCHRLDLKKFLTWLGVWDGDVVVRLRALGFDDLNDYVAHLQTSHKPRTVARHLSSLKLFLDYVDQQGLILSNPVHRMRFPEILPEPPQLLTPEEVVAFLNAPSPEHYLGLRDQAMLELLYSSGLKVNELLGLDVEDLFLDLSFLKVRARRERMVPVTPVAVVALRGYLENGRAQRLTNPQDPCLFPGRNGTRMGRVGFWALVRKYAQRAGITSPLNPRILRHSFAAHLLQNGMDLNDLRDLFGYVSLDATLQYAHINRPDYHEVYHRLHPRGRKRVSSSTTEAGEVDSSVVST